MANTRPNPFGVATPLGEGLSSVFSAFMSAPTEADRAANALKIHGLQAGAKRDLAAAGLDTVNTTKVQNELTANSSLADLIANEMNYNAIKAQSIGARGGLDPVKMNQTLLTRQALSPGAVDGMDMNRLLLAGGQEASATPFGLQTTDTTARRGQDTTAASSRYGSDRTYQASTQNNVRDNQTKRDLFTTETSPGAITTLAPGNPLGVTTINGNPTDATQKGGIIQSQRNQPGFDPMAPVDAQSSYGSALGTPNEASGGMSLTVGEDGTVQMTQGGAGVQMPTKNVSDNLTSQEAIEGYMRTSKELRSVAMADPTVFGTAGNVRRFLQSAAGQADLLLQMAGKSDPNAVKDADTVFEAVITDLSMAGVQDPSMYDPNLTDIDKLAILAAYQAAAAIAGQEGRGLSNEDFQKFRTIVGDPTAWGASQPSFVAGLNRLDRLAMGELNARRQKLGMAPIDPNAQPAQQTGSAQATKSLGGKTYVKIDGQWFEQQ